MFILSDKAYELGKKLTQVILPAITALYVGLSALWGLPAANQVAGTIALLTTFLGVCLGISSNTFKKAHDLNAGTLVIEKDEEDRKIIRLELEGDDYDLETKKAVTFMVDKRE